MTNAQPEFSVHRTVRIEAPPEVVFDFFRTPQLFAHWFGAGSTIDARVGERILRALDGALGSSRWMRRVESR